MSLVDDWVEKAEADYKGAVDLNLRRKEKLPDLVCYHCQQCAEKYLKAFLLFHGATPPRIHDLVQLLNLGVLHDGSLRSFLTDTQVLSPYGVMIRYPGMTTTDADAKDAMVSLRRLRTALRRKLGL